MFNHYFFEEFMNYEQKEQLGQKQLLSQIIENLESYRNKTATDGIIEDLIFVVSDYFENNAMADSCIIDEFDCFSYKYEDGQSDEML